MQLTITTTYCPATDIGFLLHKNPFRCQSSKLALGTINIFFPEASNDKCTVAILLDIDPVELAKCSFNPNSSIQLEQYVNDRPYVCSSFMSVALSRVFGQTLNGKCNKRPELVGKIMPLSCKISILPCKSGEPFLRKLFEPLGYKVAAKRHILDENFMEWGESCYFTVELFKETTVAELFNHLYVLIPVLDNKKHYYIDKSEIDKLVKHGEGWLESHPEKENIARRFLKHKISYTREALERLIEENPAEALESEEISKFPEEDVETTIRLNEERMGTVLSTLKSAKSQTVLDLGCGEGKLLQLLLKEKQFKKITGMDVSIRSLEIASDRLRLHELPPAQKERINLIHGSLMYRDKRLSGFDAVTIVEVIEHLDEPRLKAFERVVFEFAKPKNIILTTPNREYNVTWPNIGSSKFRHGDHRFEWTRLEFNQWAIRIAELYNYNVRFLSVGTELPNVGAPTQMAIFTQSLNG